MHVRAITGAAIAALAAGAIATPSFAGGRPAVAGFPD